MKPLALTGRLLLDGALKDGAVVVDGGRITAVLTGADAEPAALAERAEVRAHAIVAPGFVDLQVNGAFGDEVGADPGALERIARALPATGVTSWLPTLVSSTRDEYDAAFSALRSASIGPSAAAPLGFHLEGPLLSARKKGAHREAPLAQPPALADELAASGLVLMVTVAPEREGALELIRALCGRGVVVAVGHSAGGALDVARAADAGATAATHLFNAMSPFSAREPGVVGACLVEDRLVCTLIVDFVHADRIAVELAVRAKGPGRVCLVTDAMAGAGAGPGRYRLGGLDVVVDERAARLADGSLAGSILTMDAAVRNATTTSLGEAGALAAASEVPARVLGLLDRGRLAAGLRADLVCLDDALHVTHTWVAGAEAFVMHRSPAPR